MKRRIAITGSSGYLAQQLIHRLAADPEVEFILGLDLRPPPADAPAAFRRYDVTAPWQELRDVFRAQAIDTALHLAWQFNPIHDARRHRQVDVEGSQNFFRAAEAAGLRRVVYTSSTTAYVHPTNPSAPPFLAEEAAVRGAPRYLYSLHKAEVDRLAQEFLARHPEIEGVILRPSIVLGPHTDNIVSRMMEWPARSFPWIVQVRGADPPMQFVAEADMAEVLYRAVRSEARGIFNVAGEGTLRFSEVLRAAGKRPLAIPAALLYPITAALWALRLAPFPAGILDLIRYPWVADTTRLRGLGFLPRQTSREALGAFLAARRGSRRSG